MMESAENYAKNQGGKDCILERLVFPVVGKEAVHIKRVDSVRLNGGEEATVTLSSSDRLLREGWSPEHVLKAKKGDLLVSADAEVYKVMAVQSGQLKVHNNDKGYDTTIFTGPRTVKAHEYRYKIFDSVGKPKTIKVMDLIFMDRSPETTGLLDELISAIPAQHLNSFEEIRIDRQNQFVAGTFRNEAPLLGDKRIIVLLLEPEAESAADVSKPELLKVLYHELGHALINALKGNPNPGPKWKRAKNLDGNEMSKYSAKTRYNGDGGEVEDAAEAIMAYLATDGAKDAKYSALRKGCQNRFEILDKVLGDSIQQVQVNTSRWLRAILSQVRLLD